MICSNNNLLLKNCSSLNQVIDFWKFYYNNLSFTLKKLFFLLYIFFFLTYFSNFGNSYFPFLKLNFSLFPKLKILLPSRVFSFQNFGRLQTS